MSLFSELKRRNVIRVAIAYSVVAWVVIEVTSTVFPILSLPEWTVTLITVLLLAGFLPALVFAWAFELTPDGIKREKDVERSESVTHITGRKLDFLIIGALALALVFVVIDQYVLEERMTQPVVAERSIAVLPFRNRSTVAEDVHFVDGIHDDILTQLGKLSTFEKVISRTSVERYRNTTKSIPVIGDELGVAAVLEGGVQRAGQRVRINVQLIDTVRDEHLWTETFDRELSPQNILEIQSEIAGHIAQSLRTRLSAEDRAHLGKVPTRHLDAYDAYLLGRQRLFNRTTPSLEQAVELFQRAIAIDPDYALAYAGLADAWMLLGDYSGLAVEEMASRATPAATKALELDEDLAEAYTSLGAIRSKQGNYSGSQAAYERAIELDPNYSIAHHWYGDLLITYLVQPAAAEARLARALELDPFSPTINVTLGQALTGMGRFEEAKLRYRRTIELAPDYPNGYSLMAHTHKFVAGRIDEAIRWRREGVARDPSNTALLTSLADDYLDLGDDVLAERLITVAASIGPGQVWPKVQKIRLHLFRGETDEAVRASRDLLEIRPYHRTALATLVATGHGAEARPGLIEGYPSLACDGDPVVNRTTLDQALTMSLLMEQSGDQACSDLLLERTHAFLQTWPRLGYLGYGISDVMVHARRGEVDTALDTMRHAIDEGWLSLWWMQSANPQLLSLQDKPRFQVMIDEIREDVSAQRERVRAWEDAGELATIPQ